MINDVPPAVRPTVPAAENLITVAPTGAETAMADCPRLQTTRAELVNTAVACEADDRPSLDAVQLRERVPAVRERTSLVIQLGTGGNVHDSLEKGLTVQDREPDSASLTCGTTNVGDHVFVNPHPFMAQLYQQAQQRHGIDGLTAPDPRAWVHQVTEQTAASRGLKPPLEPADADIVDPFGRDDEMFVTMAQQMVQSLPAVVPAPGR